MPLEAFSHTGPRSPHKPPPGVEDLPGPWNGQPQRPISALPSGLHQKQVSQSGSAVTKSIQERIRDEPQPAHLVKWTSQDRGCMGQRKAGTQCSGVRLFLMLSCLRTPRSYGSHPEASAGFVVG